MKYNRQYEIAWHGLKPGVHVYTFDIDDSFVQAFGSQTEPGLQNWDAKVTLNFDKKSGFFLLHFDIDGSVTASCDRCNDELKIRLWDEFDLVIKLTGEELPKSNDEDDIVFIPRTETVLDISKWLYEFVMLSVPLQRIHTDLPDGTTGCNKQAIEMLERLSGTENTSQNALWKGLDELKTKQLS